MPEGLIVNVCVPVNVHVKPNNATANVTGNFLSDNSLDSEKKLGPKKIYTDVN